MAGEGKILWEAREKKGWSLSDAEEITKIRVRYIKALEEEEYELLPGTTYAKGYMRTYSKQLGLNSDEIVALYNSSIVPEFTPVLDQTKEFVKSRPLWNRRVIMAIMAIITILLIIVVIKWVQPDSKVAETPYTAPSVPTAPKTPVVETPPPSPVVSQNVVDTTIVGLTAQLAFKEDCWIEYKVDDLPATQQTFAAGASTEIKGTSKIELLSVGNAGGVTVTLNGKLLPSLGDSGQVVRNIVYNLDYVKSL